MGDLEKAISPLATKANLDLIKDDLGVMDLRLDLIKDDLDDLDSKLTALGLTQLVAVLVMSLAQAANSAAAAELLKQERFVTEAAAAAERLKEQRLATEAEAHKSRFQWWP